MAVDIKIQMIGDDKAVSTIDNITEAEREAKKAFEATNKEFKNSRQELSKTDTELGKLSKSFKNIKNAAVAAFLVNSFKTVVVEVGKTVAKFQKLEAVLTTALGSRSAAREALNGIKEFAAETPFQVGAISESFAKLANRIQGIQFDGNQFTAIGDLASATGVELDQLIEAVLDVNNTERWNELGIKVKTSGDKITGTFKGVTQTFDRSEQGALEMAEAFGKIEGVAGGMAAVSATLGGKLSNLEDNFEAVKLAVGERLAGAMSTAIDKFNDLAESAIDFIEIPVSERLREEQTELNVLVSKITDTNTSQAERNQLINELQSKYPNFLGNLNDETVSNNELANQLKQANDQYFVKIFLQRKQEEIDKQQENTANALQSRNEARNDEMTKLIESEQALGIEVDANKTLLERYATAVEVITEKTKGQTFVSGKLATASSNLRRINTEILKDGGFKADILDVEIQKTNNLKSEYNDLKASLEDEFGLQDNLITDPVKPIVESKKKLNAETQKGNDLEKEAFALAKAKRDIQISEINFLLKKNALAQEDESNNSLVQVDLINDEAELRSQLIEIKRQESLETAKLTEEKTLANQEASQSIDLLNIEIAKRKSVIEVASLETIDYEQKTADELKKINDKQLESFEKYIGKKRELTDENNDKDVKKAKLKQQILQELESIAINAVSDLSTAYFDNKQARLDNELASIQQQKDNELSLVGDSEAGKEAVEKRFEARRRQIEIEKAKQQRRQALFQIAIDTGINAVKLFAQTFPPGILSAVAILQGGIQAGIVASKPLPKFFHGVDNLQRGNNPSGIDTIPAMLHEGERVVPSYINKELLGIKNKDLPTLVSLGQHVLTGNSSNNAQIEAIVTTLVEKAIAKQPKVSHEWNEKGVETWIVEGQNKVKRTNNLFKL